MQMQLLRSFFTFFTGGFVKKYQNRSAPFSTYGLTKPFYGIDVNNACFDARNISSAEHTQDIKVPTILRNVFLWGRDEWTASLVENMENELIEYDARDNESGDLITYEAIFSEFLSTLSNNSDHFDSMYLMNEDVLERLPKSREYFTLNSTLFGEDLFQYFPTLIKPRTALIIGGEGSRSFLHADPYEWTGWNYLVEGRKLWIFLPVNITEEVLGDVWRNPPDAWGSAKYNLSAGWVSNVDLFRYKISENIGRHVMAELNSGVNSLGALHAVVMNSSLSRRWVESMMSEVAASDSDWKDVASRLSNLQVPAFRSGEEHVDRCTQNAFLSGAVQIVQEEGELVVIPPGMWHQVYHLQPSIAVAGQLMNSHNEKQVFRHMLSWCGSQPDGLEELHLKPDLSAPRRIAAVIHKCLQLQHKHDGDLLFKELYPDS